MKIKMYKIKIIIMKKIDKGVFIFNSADKYIPVGKDNNNKENIIW
jgi:hypothetical protein